MPTNHNLNATSIDYRTLADPAIRQSKFDEDRVANPPMIDYFSPHETKFYHVDFIGLPPRLRDVYPGIGDGWAILDRQIYRTLIRAIRRAYELGLRENR